MYRKPAPSVTAPDPSSVVLPGEGLRGIWVGHAIPGEVLATFGSDGEVSSHGRDVFQISYDHNTEPACGSRPFQFRFEHGLLRSISIGPYQKGLVTDLGLRIGSTRDEVIAIMGEPCERHHYRGALLDFTDDIETLRYRARGIQFGVHAGGHVGTFEIFQTSRRA